MNGAGAAVPQIGDALPELLVDLFDLLQKCRIDRDGRGGGKDGHNNLLTRFGGRMAGRPRGPWGGTKDGPARQTTSPARQKFSGPPPPSADRWLREPNQIR